MKDAELSQVSTAEEVEKFQTQFAEQQEVIERELAASDSIPREKLKDHFSSLNMSLQSLQKLYSASSPYLRIYYRKIFQDTLQALHVKLQETEAKLLPRKKFVFKGHRAKNKMQPVASDEDKLIQDTKTVDLTDGSNNCVYDGLVDADVVIPSTSVTGKAVLLSRLRNCTVTMMGAPSTVHITDVKNCSMSCGPVATSAFVEGAHSCTFQFACQQLRIHETVDTDFYIHVTSKVIIEECQNVRFGVYNYSYPTIDADYQQAGLRKDINNWREVDDFNWLVAGEPSPNWSLLDSSTN